MLSFKFLLNSIWYLLFSIGELAKQQTDNTDKLAKSANVKWKWAGHGKEGGEMLRKPLLVSDPSLDFLPGFQVSLRTDKWRQCPGKSSQEIICATALYNYTCTVISVSLGWVCIGVYFPSALVSNDFPLGHYLWCWRKILLSLFLSFYIEKRNQNRSDCVEC